MRGKQRDFREKERAVELPVDIESIKGYMEPAVGRALYQRLRIRT